MERGLVLGQRARGRACAQAHRRAPVRARQRLGRRPAAAPTRRTRSWSRTRGTSTREWHLGLTEGPPTRRRRVTRSSTATSAACTAGPDRLPVPGGRVAPQGDRAGRARPAAAARTDGGLTGPDFSKSLPARPHDLPGSGGLGGRLPPGLGDLDLPHLQHRGHHALRLSRSGSSRRRVSADGTTCHDSRTCPSASRTDPPRRPRQLAPVLVDLLLVLAADLERDRLAET